MTMENCVEVEISVSHIGTAKPSQFWKGVTQKAVKTRES